MKKSVNISAVAVFDRFESELTESMETKLGIEEIESYEGIDTLRRQCPNLKSVEERLQARQDEAVVQMEKDYSEQAIAVMEDDEYDDLLEAYILNINACKLDEHDKTVIVFHYLRMTYKDKKPFEVEIQA